MFHQKRLAIVEDNQKLSSELEDVFKQEGWEVYLADCGEQLDSIMKVQAVPIVILDLSLPDEDGIDILKRIKAAYPSIGVIILTARVTSLSKIEGYESGADVYITKPARAKELIFATNNLFKRISVNTTDNQKNILDINSLRLITMSGAFVRLTWTESNILRILAISPNQKIESEILKIKLGDESITKENLEVIISRLRSKLKKQPELSSSEIIKAIWGKGYQLCLPIELKT